MLSNSDKTPSIHNIKASPYSKIYPSNAYSLKSGKTSTASTSTKTNSHYSLADDSSLVFSSSTKSKLPSNVLREPRLFSSQIKSPKPPPKPIFVSPARALLDCYDVLTSYEHDEISFYDEIYFVGKNCEKIKGKYQDAEGYYNAVIGDHIAYRYEIKSSLGSGTFGHVYQCYDYKRHINVAIKIIRNQNLYRKAGDLEKKILHELAKADPNDVNCIVKKLRSFEFRGDLWHVLAK